MHITWILQYGLEIEINIQIKFVKFDDARRLEKQIHGFFYSPVPKLKNE